MMSPTSLGILLYLTVGFVYVSAFHLKLKPYHNYLTQFLIFLGNLLLLSAWPIGLILFIMSLIFNLIRGAE